MRIFQCRLKPKTICSVATTRLVIAGQSCHTNNRQNAYLDPLIADMSLVIKMLTKSFWLLMRLGNIEQLSSEGTNQQFKCRIFKTPKILSCRLLGSRLLSTVKLEMSTVESTGHSTVEEVEIHNHEHGQLLLCAFWTRPFAAATRRLLCSATLPLRSLAFWRAAASSSIRSLSARARARATATTTTATSPFRARRPADRRKNVRTTALGEGEASGTRRTLLLAGRRRRWLQPDDDSRAAATTTTTTAAVAATATSRVFAHCRRVCSSSSSMQRPRRREKTTARTRRPSQKNNRDFCDRHMVI